jgi:phage tail sheath gpL-like
MKLADDGTRFAPGSSIVTPSIIGADLVAQYQELEWDGFVQDSDTFAQALIVQRNATNVNRVDVLWPGTLINQLRIFALLAQFRL